MIRFIILLLISVSLSGCFTTKKRCLRLYPPEQSSDTVVISTVRDSVVVKDTTIFVDIPGETIFDSVPFPVYVDRDIKLDTARAETEFAIAKAYYSNKAIHIYLQQKETTLSIKLDSALRESYQWEVKYTEILNKEIVKEKYIPTIYKVSFWIVIGQLIIIILFFLARRLKPFQNTP